MSAIAYLDVIMRNAMAPLALSAVVLLLGSCAPKQPAATASTGPSVPAGPSISAAAPAATSPGGSTTESKYTPPAGSTAEMLLKAGFDIPKTDIMASDFTLTSLEGKKVKLSSFKGKVVFLSFWATWCGPCKAELPSVQAMYQKLKGKGLELLAVDVMEDRKTVSDFLQANGMSFPVLLDSDGSVGGTYGSGSIPTNFIIDRSGKILARIVGYDGVEWTSEERLALFDKLLAL
jgi:thiol-disulfide isomerase/thioredoxin